MLHFSKDGTYLSLQLHRRAALAPFLFIARPLTWPYTPHLWDTGSLSLNKELELSCPQGPFQLVCDVMSGVSSTLRLLCDAPSEEARRPWLGQSSHPLLPLGVPPMVGRQKYTLSRWQWAGVYECRGVGTEWSSGSIHCLNIIGLIQTLWQKDPHSACPHHRLFWNYSRDGGEHPEVWRGHSRSLQQTHLSAHLSAGEWDVMEEGQLQMDSK